MHKFKYEHEFCNQSNVSRKTNHKGVKFQSITNNNKKHMPIKACSKRIKSITVVIKLDVTHI